MPTIPSGSDAIFNKDASVSVGVTCNVRSTRFHNWFSVVLKSVWVSSNIFFICLAVFSLTCGTPGTANPCSLLCNTFALSTAFFTRNPVTALSCAFLASATMRSNSGSAPFKLRTALYRRSISKIALLDWSAAVVLIFLSASINVRSTASIVGSFVIMPGDKSPLVCLFR